jgi:hypothetical protein
MKKAEFRVLDSNALIMFTRDHLVELAMQLIDLELDNHGVESIRHEPWWDGQFWMDCGAIYSNTGDGYKATVLYDVRKEVFLVTSWADWYEANDPKGGRE